MPDSTDQPSAFLAEVGELVPRLHEAVRDLYSPLGELARAHIRDAQPPVLGAVVLAAGLANPDTARLREQRVLLAAALEMLEVALSIHKLLLTAAADSSLDKSLVGSTILTGDFCFSRAASLAAQTESPVVVDLFAQALQRVSEGHLQRLFASQEAPFDERRALAAAGVQAVAHLAALSPAAADAALDAALRLLDGAPSPAQAPALSPAQQARWQAAHEWRLQHAAGATTPTR